MAPAPWIPGPGSRPTDLLKPAPKSADNVRDVLVKEMFAPFVVRPPDPGPRITDHVNSLALLILFLGFLYAFREN